MLCSDRTNARYEARARAWRAGSIVRKCRSRNPELPGFGGFMLIDAWTNSIVLGADGWAYSASIEDIDDYLSR
jgi:hypothetical protein